MTTALKLDIKILLMLHDFSHETQNALEVETNV